MVCEIPGGLSTANRAGQIPSAEATNAEVKFEALRSRVTSAVNTALNKPITYGHFEFLVLMASFSDNDMFEIDDPTYLDSSFRLNYSEVAKLSENQLEQLQQAFYKPFVDKLDDIPPELAEHIEPGSIANVLVHEIDHFRAIPEPLQEHAYIDIVIYQDRNHIEVDGFAAYEQNKATPQQRAWIAIAPQSLSESDITSALSSADDTGDPAFVNEIRSLISTRALHGPIINRF